VTETDIVMDLVTGTEIARSETAAVNTAEIETTT